MRTQQRAEIIEAMAAAGLKPAGAEDLPKFRALAERLIGPPLASLEVIEQVEAHTGGCVFLSLSGQLPTGVVAHLPLTAAGLAAVAGGYFNGLDPSLEHLAREGEAASAVYLWCFAADGKAAGAAVIKATLSVRDNLYADRPYFARVANNLGGNQQPNAERVLRRRFNAEYFPGQPALLFSDRSLAHQRAAA